MNIRSLTRVTALLFIVTALLSTVGCKAGPAKGAGFIDKTGMIHDKSLPWQSVWFKPGFDKSQYTKIYIAPVNTSYLLKTSNWQKGERKDQFEADVAKIGTYAQTTIKKAFTDDPKHRFAVVDAEPKESGALIFEMAIIEVVPSKVVLNALGYAPFFIGTGITIVRAAARDVSTVAFEGKFRDAGTGETVATFADREAEQAAIVSVRGLTWYSHANVIISQWSTQFVQWANQKPGEVIKDTDPFTLQPW